jgi:hypothetical protein
MEQTETTVLELLQRRKATCAIAERSSSRRRYRPYWKPHAWRPLSPTTSLGGFFVLDEPEALQKEREALSKGNY